MKIAESEIPEELNGQPQIVIGTKGDRDRFVDWAKVSIGVNSKVHLIGIDLSKMVTKSTASIIFDYIIYLIHLNGLKSSHYLIC